MTARLIRMWLSTAAAMCFVFMLPLGASAQLYQGDRDEGTVSPWDHLQQLSTQLERQATRARAEAKADERHRGSEEYAERLDDFAKEAHGFRLLVNDRTVPSSKINDRLRKLLDDARKVQQESARAERHNPQTDTDWNRTLTTLNQINDYYLAANGLAAPPGDRRYGSERPRPSQDADDRPFPTTGYTNSRALLDELDRRSDDALRLSESGRLDITPDIERLRNAVRSFERDTSGPNYDDRRENINKMLSEARAAQASLSGSNAPSRLVDDVNAIVDTLTQLRDSGMAVGTSGYQNGYQPGASVGSYANMDFAQLTEELNDRVANLSNFAGQYASDDVTGRIAQFSDRVRDFDNRSARMSQEDRRESIDRLLQDAQKIQRDLAGRHVSTPVMNRWNDIVDLLVHLRDRS